MLSLLMVCFSVPIAATQKGQSLTPAQLANMSYLDLLEMENIPKLSDDQINAVKKQLEQEKGPSRSG